MARVTINPRIKSLSQAADFVQYPGLMDELMKVVGSAFRTDSRKLFSSEGSAGGERWRALSARYERQKRKQRPGRKILTYDGRLRDSLSQEGHPLHIADWYRVSKGVFLKFGSSDPVGAYHAPGTYHSPKLPVRDPIQRSKEQVSVYLKRIQSVLVPHVIRAIRDRAALGAS